VVLVGLGLSTAPERDPREPGWSDRGGLTREL